MKMLLAATLVIAMVFGMAGSAGAEDIQLVPNVQPPQKAEWMDMINRVKFIGDRDVSHITPENVQRVWFSFQDENEERIEAPSIVDVTILNDNNELVFDRTIYLSPDDFGTWTNTLTNTGRLLCSFDISDTEIKAGSCKTGKLTMTVHYKSEHYNNGLIDAISFEPWIAEVGDLPYASPSDLCFIDIPKTPIHVRNQEGIDKLVTRIDDITYKFEDYGSDGQIKLEILFTGEKTYDPDGKDTNKACQIGYKLYHEGYVIKSGVLSTSILTQGEKYKDQSLTFYDLKPGEFKLQILDVG